MTQPDIIRLIEAEQRAGKLPVNLTRSQVSAIGRSLQNYAANLGASLTQRQLDAIEDAIKKAAASYVNPQVVAGKSAGLGQSTAREFIATAIKAAGADGLLAGNNIDFALHIASRVAFGAAQHVAMNEDGLRVQENPALEFHRIYDRDVPRGERLGKGGALIEVPDEAWPARWAAAGDAAGDDDWLPWEGDDQAGRGVALKSSGIWPALGDGAGGYADSLGNPSPPFAFNSGFGVDELSRADAEALGLLHAGETARPATLDLKNLFADF